MINGARFETVPELEYERCSHAAHRDSAEHADTFQRASRIHLIFRRIAENAVAALIKHEAMQVHGTAYGVLKHPVPIGVSGAIDAGVGSDPKQALECRKIVQPHSEIEIGVRPRLLAEKSIDPPTTVDPKGKAFQFEEATQMDQVFKFHGRLFSRLIGLKASLLTHRHIR